MEQRQIVGERRRGLLHAFFPSAQSNPIQELCHFRDYKYSLRRLSPVNRLKACLNLPAIAKPFLVANHSFIRGFVRPLIRWSVGPSVHPKREDMFDYHVLEPWEGDKRASATQHADSPTHTQHTRARFATIARVPALLNINSFFLSYLSFYRKTEIWVQTCEAEINEICRQWDQILFDESSEYHVGRLLQLKVLSSIQPRLYIYSCFPVSHSPSPPPFFLISYNLSLIL